MSIEWIPDEGWQRLQDDPAVIAFTVVFTLIYIGAWLGVCVWLNRRAR